MPWPEPVGLLLARSDSRASQALRWGLRGLRASLQAVLEEVPGDPGCVELRGLLGSEWGASENNRRAKYYRLTAAGRRYLEAESAQWDRLVTAIARVMEA